MQIWEERLSQMLDQVADYAGDWDCCLDMVAAVPPSPLLHDYLEFLTPRLKQMQRKFNWVEYDARERYYSIHNYTYEMYRFFRLGYGDKVIITPQTIRIASEDLTPEIREQLQKAL